MTETSTLTPHQELVNKLKTGHPQKQILEILKRIEALEGGRPTKVSLCLTEDGKLPKSVLTRSEKMKLAWAKRKANEKENG